MQPPSSPALQENVPPPTAPYTRFDAEADVPAPSAYPAFDASVDAPALTNVSPPTYRREWGTTGAVLIAYVAILAWDYYSLVSLPWREGEGEKGEALKTFHAGFYEFCVQFAGKDEVCLSYEDKVADALTALGLSTASTAPVDATVCDAPTDVAAMLVAGTPSLKALGSVFSFLCSWKRRTSVSCQVLVCVFGALALLAALASLSVKLRLVTWRERLNNLGIMLALCSAAATVAAFILWESDLEGFDYGWGSYFSIASAFLLMNCAGCVCTWIETETIEDTAPTQPLAHTAGSPPRSPFTEPLT